jgi:hypothetical protein
MAENTPKQNKLSDGGLWNKVSEKTGNSYFFGKITLKDGETVLFKGFKNTYKKEGEKSADYRLFLAEDRPQEVIPKGVPIVAVCPLPNQDDDDTQL